MAAAAWLLLAMLILLGLSTALVEGRAEEWCWRIFIADMYALVGIGAYLLIA